jgi:formylmethanofuran dehydrogenase subunit E
MDELAKCTRCEEMVDSASLMKVLDWNVCGDCWGDI